MSDSRGAETRACARSSAAAIARETGNRLINVSLLVHGRAFSRALSHVKDAALRFRVLASAAEKDLLRFGDLRIVSAPAFNNL